MKKYTVELSSLIYYISIYAYFLASMLSISMIGQLPGVSTLCTVLRFFGVIGAMTSFAFRTRFAKKYCILTMFLIVGLIISAFFTGDHGALLMTLVIISAWGADGNSILKIFLGSSGLIVFISWMMARAGLIQDRVFQFWRISGKPLLRHSYGMTYTTTFAAAVFFIIAAVFYLFYEKDKRNIFKIFIVGVSSIILYFTYKGTQGRLEFGMGVILLLLFLLMSVWNKFCASKSGKFILTALPIICVICSFGSAYMFMINQTKYAFLDWLMTGRLSIAAKAIKQYGINLFGHTVRMIGSGTVGTVDVTDYFFIDSFYINWTIVYGVVVVVVLLVLYIWINKKTIENRNYKLMICLSLVYLHGIIMSSIMHPELNPFFCVAIAEISSYYQLDKE